MKRTLILEVDDESKYHFSLSDLAAAIQEQLAEDFCITILSLKEDEE